MGTDKLLSEYTAYFPNALAKFIHAATDDYEAKSLTFKEIEKRADIFLIGRSGEHVVLVETQGYNDDELFYSMVKKIMLYCTQNKYRGSMDAVAIFLEESHARAAAAPFEEQFGRTAVLKFAPRVFVFSRIKVEALSQLHDIYLTPLYPLCDVTPEEITQQAPGWANQIKSAPELAVDERKNLLSFLGGAISHRIKTTTEEVISKLFGGFIMEDTPVVQQIVERVEKRVEERMEKRGIEKIQHLLLKQLAARFGVVPEDIQKKVQAIHDTENLERIATLLLTIQSMDELKDLVN